MFPCRRLFYSLSQGPRTSTEYGFPYSRQLTRERVVTRTLYAGLAAHRCIAGDARELLIRVDRKTFFGKCKVLMSQKSPYGTKTLCTKFELDL